VNQIKANWPARQFRSISDEKVSAACLSGHAPFD
jgi:hypothetical protein